MVFLILLLIPVLVIAFPVLVLISEGKKDLKRCVAKQKRLAYKRHIKGI